MLWRLQRGGLREEGAGGQDGARGSGRAPSWRRGKRWAWLTADGTWAGHEAGGHWSPAVTCDKALVSPPWLYWPCILGIWGLEGWQR